MNLPSMNPPARGWVSYGGKDGSDLPLKQVVHEFNSSPPETKVNKKRSFLWTMYERDNKTKLKKMKNMAKNQIKQRART
jgi:hypothetical protein